jgi:hypothetical protein
MVAHGDDRFSRVAESRIKLPVEYYDLSTPSKRPALADSAESSHKAAFPSGSTRLGRSQKDGLRVQPLARRSLVGLSAKNMRSPTESIRLRAFFPFRHRSLHTLGSNFLEFFIGQAFQPDEGVLCFARPYQLI